MEAGREPLSEWQNETVVNDVGYDKQERVNELQEHTVEELADYVYQLAVSVPPNETLTRREIYHWDPVEAEHYARWGKKELIRRIIAMEIHDDARLEGKRPPYREKPPEDQGQPQPSEPVSYRKVEPRRQEDMTDGVAE